MTVLFLLLTLCALGTAIVTFKSGLPQFGMAITVSVLTGLALMTSYLPVPGFLCFACTVALILYSKHLMQKHCVGPYADEHRDAP